MVSKYFPLVRKHWLPLSLGTLGMIFFAYGLIGLFSSNKGTEDIVFEASSEKNSIETRTILVDIEGAVVKPGVYKVPQESRIQDAFVVAGGLAATADRDYIAKNFNLATKLTDGAKIYVPFLGEAASAPSVLSSSSEGVIVGALVNINSASESQLDTLPGIGPVTAQKIIAGRPYSSVNELLDKKIVGAKVFEQIKNKISIY
ncbi:MAG: competence protein ComEA, competence protein ComEA [Candidatus Levybacteria bacterium]|nr:competence protein ComEA, competence protein ComEA [Candidatus Levybacteria bacterium]